MNLEWNLHLNPAVIGDGESPELHVGDVIDWFASSFWSDAVLTRAAERTKSAVPIADNYYRVNAEVIYISHDPNRRLAFLTSVSRPYRSREEFWEFLFRQGVRRVIM
jgi:hypothetical protein